MIGRKSIFTNIKIKKFDSDEKVMVTVQADKNYRICDVIFPVVAVTPSKPTDASNKEAMQLYKTAKLHYDRYILDLKEMRQIALNYYRGRQANDSEVMEHLRTLLFTLYNREK